ncbi:sodium:proton antiporter [Holzapfeliella sp. He02]|uniref:Sodium:proton antiporter n=1 Tax=Holzapfeliella saturejae TaxID=3082953 RepID=A0ABU8SHM8_9LACO
MLIFLLGLFFVIILANFLANIFPKIPQAIWQTVLGIVLAMIPSMQNYVTSLDPQWFLPIVIAPLLFYEGQQTTRQYIVENSKEIFQLSFWLAFMCMGALMLFIHYVLGWPFSIALAVAAIVTPTDATALGSIKSNFETPEKLSDDLEMESMFNDATVVVALELSLIWVRTGHISPIEGFLTFIYAAVGGIIFGVLASVVIIFFRNYLLKHHFNDATSQVLIQLLTPILIYIIAEEIGVSAFIAVVMAGIFHHEEQEQTLLMSSQMTNLMTQLWGVLSQILNGIVFGILGVSLVIIFKNIEFLTDLHYYELIGISLCALLLFFVIRTLFYFYTGDDTIDKRFQWQNAIIFGISGVHGSVTLAMALSLPSIGLLDYRDDILVVASFVIVFSFVIPLIVLPFLLPGRKIELTIDEVQEAHQEIVAATIAHIDTLPIDNQTKLNLSRRIHTQTGLSKRTLFSPKELKHITTSLSHDYYLAVQQATVKKQLSPEAVELFNRLKSAQQNNQTSLNVLFSFRRRHREFRSLKLENSPEVTEAKLVKIRQKIKRIDHQLKFIKLPVYHAFLTRRRQKLVIDYEYLSYFKKIIVSDSLKAAFKELKEILKPVTTKFLKDYDYQTENKQKVIALRQLLVLQSSQVDGQLDSKLSENQYLMALLQYELTFIIDNYRNNKYSQALFNQLYDEIISAQSTLLALG